MENIKNVNENVNTEVETGTEETTGTETTEKTTYTKEEVEKLLQAETDRRVTQALKKAERKKAEAVKEAEKLAKMNEEEKFKYELEQREKAIEEKEKQLALAENKSICATILNDKGLPVGLVDFVVDVDADTMQDKIKTLDKYFKQAVKAEVEKRLSSATPKKNLPLNESLTKEQFMKMSLQQQTEIYRNNPELYKSLTN